MKTKTYKKEEIIDYLLGSLPEAEAEFFDELSFTDDGFADELKASEKDLIDSYVNQELTGKKLEKFESYYLASPLRREKVEFAKAFQVFANDKTSENTEIIEENSVNQKAGFFSNLFTIPRLSMQWGLGFAALLLLIFGGFILWENSRLRDEMSQTQTNRDEILQREAELAAREKQLNDEISNQRIQNSEKEKELARIREEQAKIEQELKLKQLQERQKEQVAAVQKQTPIPQKRQPNILSFVLAPALRGNQLPTFDIPANTDSVRMKLELETTEYSAYRVALQNPGNGQILWQSGKIKSSGNSLNVSFPAKLLKTQVYSLQVSGITNENRAEIISDYSFRVMR